MSTVMEIDRRIVGELLPLLRAGDRLRVLLQRLPSAEQERILKLNRIPVHANGPHRARVVRTQLAKLGPRLQQDGPARSVVETWATPQFVRIGLADDRCLPGDWTAALLLRLLDGGQLPTWLRSACDGLIAGSRGGFDEAEQAAAEQWIRWSRARAHLTVIGAVLEAAATSIASCWQAPAQDCPFERWQALEVQIGRLADVVAATKAKVATAADCLWDELAHLLPVSKAEGDDALTGLLDQRADIETGLAAVQASLETSPARLKPRLNAMLEALEGHVPERDLSILRAGMDAAFANDDADAPAIDSLADLQPVAPVLHAVARVLLDGCPREDFRDLLLDHLTGRSCLYLEQHASSRASRPEGHTPDGAVSDADEATVPDGASEASDGLHESAEDAEHEGPAGDDSTSQSDPADEDAASEGDVATQADLTETLEVAPEPGEQGGPADAAVTATTSALIDAVQEPTGGEASVDDATVASGVDGPAPADETVEASAAVDAAATEEPAAQDPVAQGSDEPVDDDSVTLADDDGDRAIDAATDTEVDGAEAMPGAAQSPTPDRSGESTAAAAPEASPHQRTPAAPSKKRTAKTSDPAPERQTEVRSESEDSPEANEADPAEDLIGQLDAAGAAELLLQAPDRPGPTLTALVARLIRNRELGSAFLLAEAAGEALEIPVWLVEVVELGVQFQPGFHRSEQRLYTHFVHTAPDAGPLDAAQSRLLMAALVRPALMAPHTTSPGFLLHRLAEDLPELRDVAEPLAEFSERGIPLAGSLLRGLTSEAEWTARREELERDTERWLEEAPRRRIKYDAATRVWEYWVKEDGDLRTLIDRATALPTASDELDELRRDVERWQSDASFTDRLDAADRQCNRRARKMPIKYGARTALKRYADDALEIVEACLDLAEARPEDGGRPEALGRELLDALREPAQRLVDSLSPIDAIDHAAATRLREVLEEVIDTFRREDLPHRREDPLAARRSLRLRVPPSESAITTLDDVLRHLRAPMDDAAALRAHLKVGGLDEARLLLSAGDWHPNEESALRDELDASERRWRAVVLRRVESLVDAVEDAHLKGALDGKERDLLSGQLAEFERAASDDVHGQGPRAVLASLTVLQAELDASVEARLAQTRERRDQLVQLFEERGQPFPPDLLAEVLAEVDRALDDRDISVASDLLARAQRALRQGTAALEHIIPQPTRTPDFDDLARALPGLHAEARDLPGLIRGISAGPGLPALQLGDIDANTHAQFVQILEHWRVISEGPSRPRVDQERLYSVLNWLGFQIEASAPFSEAGRHGPPHNWIYYRLAAKAVSPVPLFGSAADGQHYFVLAWGNVSPDQLAQWLAANIGSKAKSVTVLLFTRLTLTERRRAIHSMRAMGAAPLVVDLNLLVWLGRFSPLERTRALFGAGLAGVAYNPYTPEVAGGVPSEMFFGRDDDIEQLWSKEGPCIVYGGRQLGKSAMLQQVIRRYHEPEHEQWVLYRGIKTTKDLWDVIRDLLVKSKLLKNKGVYKPESISAAIRDMLEEHPSRRVLVLLDECDYLLDQDRLSDFDQVSRVRELMTETSRRFKVVFTGLHNVQRFQRIANQPLAHFGTPICIGPLKPKAAADLVTKPLAALGYRFQSQSLVQRILAHTNCHPCLLQLFCSELVRTRLQSQRTNVDLEPPFIIDEKAISAVYRQVDLAQRMRERFDWTLDLDLRYRAIGYTFAWLELAGEFADDAASGLPVGQILDILHQTWPQGFASTTEDEIAGLLEELVGLGVLMVSNGPRFRLRSPNVLRLLGGETDVIDELNRLARTNYVEPADPHVLRRVREGGALGRTSPLTLSQEAKISQRERGVDVVLGSAATRIEHVLAAAVEVFRPDAGEVIHPVTLSAKTTVLDALAAVRREYGSSDKDLRLLFEVNGMPTSQVASFIEGLADWLASLKSQQRFVRATIVLDAAQTLALRRDDRLRRIEAIELVNIHRLRRWKPAALADWFDAVNRPPTRPDMAKRLMDETGGWPCLLEHHQAKHMDDQSVPLVERTALLTLAGARVEPAVEKVIGILRHFAGELVDTRTLQDLVNTETGMPRPLFDAVRGYLLDMNLVLGSDEAVQLEPTIAEVLTAAP